MKIYQNTYKILGKKCSFIQFSCTELSDKGTPSVHEHLVCVVINSTLHIYYIKLWLTYVIG